MDSLTFGLVIVLAPIVAGYIGVMTKLLYDYLTTKEVFHGPKQGGNQ